MRALFVAVVAVVAITSSADAARVKLDPAHMETAKKLTRPDTKYGFARTEHGLTTQNGQTVTIKAGQVQYARSWTAKGTKFFSRTIFGADGSRSWMRLAIAKDGTKTRTFGGGGMPMPKSIVETPGGSVEVDGQPAFPFGLSKVQAARKAFDF